MAKDSNANLRESLIQAKEGIETAIQAVSAGGAPQEPRNLQPRVAAPNPIRRSLHTLASERKVEILQNFGADQDTIDMILELDRHIEEAKAKAPDLVGAWGGGCGGVTC